MSYRLVAAMVGIALIFTLGFYRNQWRATNPEVFNVFQRDSESLMVGRLIKSDRDGMLSTGALPGRVGPVPETTDKFQYQYDAYDRGTPFETYTTYRSQNAFQGVGYSIVDRLTALSPAGTLSLLHLINSLLLATAVTAIAAWVYAEFGMMAAAAMLLSALYSQWLTLFGRNLYWSTWSFYVPFIVALVVVRKRMSTRASFVFVGLGFLVKCFFGGFEYITTTAIMTMVPIVYRDVLHRATARAAVINVAMIGSAAVLATMVSAAILVTQIALVSGEGMKGALDYLFVYTLGKRTFGNPSDYPEVYAASLDASVLSVVRMYVQQVAYDLKPVFRSSLGLFKVRYDVVFIMFILATAPVVMAARSYRFRFLEGIRRRRPILALAAALWFSSLAPLSWLVVFKGHSYLHAHMNSIVWQMPFTFLGFALWGAVISAMRDRGD